MRNIKFRAKVKYNGNHYFEGEWVKGHYHQNTGGRYYIFDNDNNYMKNIGDFTRYEDVEIDENTLGQFTGKTDKNGVEIYEGDIYKDVYGRIYTIEYRIAITAFQMSIVFPQKPFQNRYATTITDGGEVIGNVYDNRDILESVKSVDIIGAMIDNQREDK